MPSAVSLATSPSRSLTTTLAPCSASSSAVALPIPPALPVTIATLSSRTPMQLLLLGSQEAGDPIDRPANQASRSGRTPGIDTRTAAAHTSHVQRPERDQALAAEGNEALAPASGG